MVDECAFLSVVPNMSAGLVLRVVARSAHSERHGGAGTAEQGYAYVAPLPAMHALPKVLHCSPLLSREVTL